MTKCDGSLIEKLYTLKNRIMESRADEIYVEAVEDCVDIIRQHEAAQGDVVDMLNSALGALCACRHITPIDGVLVDAEISKLKAAIAAMNMGVVPDRDKAVGNSVTLETDAPNNNFNDMMARFIRTCHVDKMGEFSFDTALLDDAVEAMDGVRLASEVGNKPYPAPTNCPNPTLDRADSPKQSADDVGLQREISVVENLLRRIICESDIGTIHHLAMTASDALPATRKPVSVEESAKAIWAYDNKGDMEGKIPWGNAGSFNRNHYLNRAIAALNAAGVIYGD